MTDHFFDQLNLHIHFIFIFIFNGTKLKPTRSFENKRTNILDNHWLNRKLTIHDMTYMYDLHI